MRNSGVREKVILLRTKNPGVTLRKLALELGVSFQRVHQILRSEGQRTSREKKTFYCVVCKKPLESGKRKYHPDCYQQEHKPVVVCFFCGDEKTILGRDYRRAERQGQTHFYCTRACLYAAKKRNSGS